MSNTRFKEPLDIFFNLYSSITFPMKCLVDIILLFWARLPKSNNTFLPLHGIHHPYVIQIFRPTIVSPKKTPKIWKKTPQKTGKFVLKLCKNDHCMVLIQSGRSTAQYVLIGCDMKKPFPQSSRKF